MPEGPEIRLAADRIAAAVEGRKLREVWFAFDRLKPWEPKLSGRKVREVATRGKAVLVRFTGGLNLYSHNQLYGKWFVTTAGKTPRTGRQLRVALHAKESSALLYSASDIEVLRDAELERHAYLGKLGPDVLDRDVTARAVRDRLLEDRFARRSLAALLLDQGFLGGVGNYLRSEILFVAGADPAARPVDMDAPERSALARAALAISRRAYRTRGVTNDPAVVKQLRAEGTRRRDYRHFVFGRDGEPCHRCGTEIVKLMAAGRRLYRCPDCQA